MFTSSVVVSTRSIRRSPSFSSSGRAASNFFAVHGMMATEKTSSPLNCWRISAPNISIGLPQVETWGIRCGCLCSTCWIQPGQQEVNIGSFAPVLTFSRNSADSSMMVRSAVRFVSYTTSAPRRRRAVTSLPVTASFAGMPNSSAMPTRTDGANCTTTFLSLLCSIFHIFGTSFLIVIAPVGHTAAH